MLREVIIVDDSDADLLYTQVVLEAAAVARRVLAFGTGAQALAHLASGAGAEVDLVLLDINMPEMSGFEFLEAWATRPHPGEPAVVMLTSSPDPEDRARALAFRCVRAYAVKPIDLEVARSLEAMPRAAPGAGR